MQLVYLGKSWSKTGGPNLDYAEKFLETELEPANYIVEDLESSLDQHDLINEDTEVNGYFGIFQGREVEAVTIENESNIGMWGDYRVVEKFDKIMESSFPKGRYWFERTMS